ncbi:serine/threonine-protein kinase [Nonomuraea sp. B19D2]|uniref:serine/threonine-protein kinase n=1 Tax=Nonomuraea sp. B19D2 TaxID=3159561 RepID=UPI0032DA4F07
MRQGTTVGGRYQLVKCLVSSTTTEVWLALELPLNRKVVLKRLLADGAESSRLLAEARALASFNHPHVVTLYGTEGDWLVMEHVAHGSLADRLDMSPRQAAHVGTQIAGALAALHAKGIVHLDVKPANIVDTGDGDVKLADFGAAYRVGDRDTLTVNGAISYTVAYAAPEIVLGQPDPKSDVFSLGATLYALVAGRPPGRGAADGESDADVTAWEAAWAEVELTADVGPLDGLLREMLRRDPRERPGIGQVQARLAEIAGLSPAGEAVPPRAEAIPAGAAGARWRALAFLRRRWPLALVMAGAASAAVAVPIVLSTLRDQPVDERLSASTPGSSQASASPASPVIGDPRTADPCALLSPTALGRFGRTELDIDYGNFERCDVILFPPGGGVVDVQAAFAREEPPELAKLKTVGKVSVVEHPAESRSCDRTIVLPGVADTVVYVDTEWEEPGKADLCEIGDAATAVAAKVLSQGPLARRSPPLPANSLAHKDACTLLSAKALEVVPGIDATDPGIEFGHWECSWRSTTSKTYVRLRFDRGQRPNAEDDGTVTMLNGYRAFVQPKEDNEWSCLVQVVYRAYTDQDGRTAVETVRVVVEGSRPMRQKCQMATGLARSATTRLRGP